MADWKLEITKVENGYLLEYPDEDSEGNYIRKRMVLEEDEKDELKSNENLLWQVMEHFGFYGSKHDKERIRITREKN